MTWMARVPARFAWRSRSGAPRGLRLGRLRGRRPGRGRGILREPGLQGSDAVLELAELMGYGMKIGLDCRRCLSPVLRAKRKRPGSRCGLRQQFHDVSKRPITWGRCGDVVSRQSAPKSRGKRASSTSPPYSASSTGGYPVIAYAICCQSLERGLKVRMIDTSTTLPHKFLTWKTHYE